MGVTLPAEAGCDAVAVVSSSGVVHGVAEGVAAVTAAANVPQPSGTSAGIGQVSVYTPVSSLNARTTRLVSVQAGADNMAPTVSNLARNTDLRVVCTLGSWFRVEATGGAAGFVPRNAVHIPVTGVTVSPAAVAVGLGESTSLVVRVVPELASDKTVTWRVVKLPVKVRVSDSGVVTGRQVGKALVVASSVDGPSSQVVVNVTGLGGLVAQSPDPGQLRIVWLGKVAPSASKWWFWCTGLDGQARFKLQMKLPGGRFSQVGQTKVSSGKPVSWPQVQAETSWIGKTVKFRVVAYPGKGVGQVMSNTVSVVAGRPVNQTGTVSAWPPRVSWEQVSGARGYEVWRKVTGGKYGRVHTVKDGKTRFWDDRAAQRGQFYSYKVVALRAGKHSKLVPYRKTSGGRLFSATVGVRVVTPGQTQIVRQAGATAAITDAIGPNLVDASVINTSAEQPMTLSDSENTVSGFPYVKYVWQGSCSVLGSYRGPCLQIHAYVDFVQGSSVWQAGDQTFARIRELSRQGLSKYFDNVLITGGGISADFRQDLPKDRVTFTFRTKLVLWERSLLRGQVSIRDNATGREMLLPHQDQRFLPFEIGCSSCAEPWYSAAVTGRYGIPNPKSNSAFLEHINVPWDHDAKASSHHSMMFGSALSRTMAHEFGHALGLADAYYDAAEGGDRMDETSETTMDTITRPANGPATGVRYASLMKSQSVHILPNDLEMMLNAYKISFTSGPDHWWQYYKTHTINLYTTDGRFVGTEFLNRSTVIRGKEPDQCYQTTSTGKESCL
jgi:hypothetical protein